LKIDTQIPAEFQDAIRGEYPMYSEIKEFSPEIPGDLLAQLPPEIANSIPIPATNRMNYKFSTPDQKWFVNLTNNFLAVSCIGYDRWENFRGHLELPLRILIEIYRPSLLSRIGLRYVNVIKRSALGLNEVSWSQLIQPYFSGILSVVDEASIRGSLSQDEIQFDNDNGIVRMVHGIASSKMDSEKFYLIDDDFFVESNMEINNATEKLDYFNGWGRKLFRWAITDRLHESMEPQPI
jgi:uncharacterized protein (TIGR04255 family)